jgi:hypothetical protein
MRIKSLKSFGFTVVLALVSLAAVPALAQTTSKSLALGRVASLGGQELSKGKYTITFDSEKDGEATLLKDGREVSKASYKLLQLEKEPADNAVIFTAADDGSLKIKRIEMKGSKTALQFE